MKAHRIPTTRAALAALVLALPSIAAAQADGDATLRPGKGRHAVGFSLGHTDFGAACGLLPGCDDGARYTRLVGRGMFSERWGAELGLLDTGRMDLGGGSTRAHGVTLNVVRQLPLSQALSAYGKLGTTYGHTATSALPGSALQAGGGRGFGLSYGAGVQWQLSSGLSAALEWDSQGFRLANGGTEPMRSTRLGLQWRY
ncbi:outer membrane beta-barrel protein [Ramlibacter sp. AN1015]|uniref:outer membrane beta-barrel protein n=1 Tax=Ramlibacter sp. AN1015 TaxID=3133428 RepID=UPI0030BD63CF